MSGLGSGTQQTIMPDSDKAFGRYMHKKAADKFDTGNGISPLNIRIFIPLLEEYCIIAPDVIGMPGKSEPYRNLDTNKDDYGLWLGEIMDNLIRNQSKLV